jgi:DNA-binding beta-propeller fold protein YncE
MKTNKPFVVSLLTLLPLACATGVASAQAGLDLVGGYDTGLAANGAEIISVRESDKIAALTNVAGSVDLLDLSDPSQINLIQRVILNPAHGTPNSVALHPSRDYFLVVSGSAGAIGWVSAYRISDGTFLAVANTGIQPDSIAISPNGRYAVIANEAEASGVGSNGGPGSLSLIDLKDFKPSQSDPQLSVQNILLPSQNGVAGFSTGRTDDIGLISIDNTPDTLEPETVTFSHDNHYAYVSLQENSGVVRLKLSNQGLTFFGLGQTTHLADLTNGGGYNPIESLTAFRESDGIGLSKNGRYFFTADEGDTRNAVGSSGPRGGRTVSVFNASTGAFISDTGSKIDDAAAAALLYPDGRSNRGGSEPEVLDVTKFHDKTLVAVGLERANAVALINGTDVSNLEVLAVAQTGARPEGVKFFRKGGDLYVLTANEEAGTVSVLEVTGLDD